jgi:allophanate hydrolase
VPALMNGIVGLKPSRGALSTRGTVPACASLDCVSLFTGDVADASAVLEVAAARDRRDPWSRELRAPGGGPPGAAARIGVPGGPQLDFFGDRAAEAAWRGALARASAAGWELVELDVDPFAEAAGLLYGGPWVAERFAAIGAFIAEHRREVDPVVAEVVLEGGLYTAAELFRAQHRLAELRAAIDPLWASLDALLMPTAPTLFTHAEVAERPRECVDVLGTYTNFANLLDLCAVAVPAGERADGLPFGVTLFGPAGADRRTLKLAARWETAMALAAGAYRAAPA